MKVVILAGGYGSRISEETHSKPKPMIEIGDHPILWHIMKIYSTYGFNEFIICLGYRGNDIKDYFYHYFLNHSDVTIDLQSESNNIVHHSYSEPWKVTLVNTGSDTMTGGRLKRIENYIQNKPFMLTYGDGLANVNIKKLVEFHEQHGKTATITAIQPNGRFGALRLSEDNNVEAFQEKLDGKDQWINGGFMVLEPDVFNYLSNDETIFEKKPLENLAKNNELMAYRHEGFWHPMDTLRDKKYLSSLWSKSNAPWKIWDE